MLFNSPRPSLKSYILYRLCRILPAYYLCLSAMLTFNNEWRYILINPDILLHYLFLFNFTEFSIFNINSVFWTIAVEMQFYLLLPIIFIFLAKNPAKAGITLIIMILICYSVHALLMSSFTLNIPWPWDKKLSWIKPQGAVLSHSLLAHLPHFLIGLLTAGVSVKHNRPDKYQFLIEALFYFVVLLLIVILSTPLLDYLLVPYGRYGFPLIPLLIVIIILTTPLSKAASVLLENTVFKTLGQLSYGIYLYHLPLLNYLYTLIQSTGYDAEDHKFLFASSAFCLTLFIASLSYRLIERPIINLIRS